MSRAIGKTRAIHTALAAVILAFGATYSTARSAEPLPLHERILHERIDALIEAGAKGHLSTPADDAEFVRRVYLDLVGIIPSAAEARSFLEDRAADKRAALIDRLLDSPRFARHMTHTFDTMLLERRTDKHVDAGAWQAYLYRSFADNKSYDRLMCELLVADGADPSTRPAAKFLLNRECEPNAVTRDVGRLYFGMDMQCSQCHDHPVVEDYAQDRYYGLQAFLVRSGPFVDKKKKITIVAEKGEGDVGYKSVFTGEASDRVTPRVPVGATLVEPAPKKGHEYAVAPSKEAPGKPTFSRRDALARLATNGESEAFNRNAANRLWAHMLGRGIVHPVDFHHPDNPPSHPKLLALLANEFRDSGYDVKRFLREVALSRTYQRSSVPPRGKAEQIEQWTNHFQVARLKALAPESLAMSIMQATGYLAVQESAARKAFVAKVPAATAKVPEEERRRAEAQLVETKTYDAVRGSVATFAALYGGTPGEDFAATLDQALFFGNGSVVSGWIKPAGGNLSDRLAKLRDDRALADELYFAILSRPPVADERTSVRHFLKTRKDDRAAAIDEMIWALLSSNEFRFNH